MSARIDIEEVLETVDMIAFQHLNIRTVTLGINVLDLASRDPVEVRRGIKKRIAREAGLLVNAVSRVSEKLGVEIVNSRLALSPVALLVQPYTARLGKKAKEELVALAEAIDEAAQEGGVDLVGGYTALVHKGETEADTLLIESVPEALSSTRRLCSSVSVADTRSGINISVIRRLGYIVKEVSERSPEGRGAACARFMVLANAPEDNPFMAGGFHGVGCAGRVVNVGISGPAVLLAAVKNAGTTDVARLAEIIKGTSFKITRVGELVGRSIAEEIGAEFGAVDISLAPAPSPRESVAEILEAMGVDEVGAPGSVGVLMLLVDSVKKGGSMAASRTGGFSGVFIPVTEDLGMARAVANASLTVQMLLAMTSVSAAGLDMVLLPGDVPPEVISSLILDQISIGVALDKSIGVRLIPVPGAKPGDKVELGGLFGSGTVTDVPRISASRFLERGGRIPPLINSLKG